MRLLWHHPLRWWRLPCAFAVIVLLLNMWLTFWYIYCLSPLKFALPCCLFSYNTLWFMKWLQWLTAHITRLWAWFANWMLWTGTVAYHIMSFLSHFTASMSMNSFWKPRHWFNHTLFSRWLFLLYTLRVRTWIISFYIQWYMNVWGRYLSIQLLMVYDLRWYQRFGMT